MGALWRASPPRVTKPRCPIRPHRAKGLSSACNLLAASNRPCSSSSVRARRSMGHASRILLESPRRRRPRWHESSWAMCGGKLPPPAVARHIFSLSLGRTVFAAEFGHQGFQALTFQMVMGRGDWRRSSRPAGWPSASSAVSPTPPVPGSTPDLQIACVRLRSGHRCEETGRYTLQARRVAPRSAAQHVKVGEAVQETQASRGRMLAS